MTQARQSRRGFALPTVVLVLALLTLLAAAAVEAARTGRRDAALAQADSQLQAAAERALGDAAATWPARIGDLAIGERATIDGGITADGVGATVTVTRISPALFWATAEARIGAGRLAREAGGTNGRRRINGIFSLPALRVASDGVVLAAGNVEIRSPAAVSTDSARAGCPPLPADSAFIAVPPGDSVIGAPGTVPWRQLDLAADPATLDRWGGVDWASLAATADLDLAAGEVATADGDCGVDAVSRWGGDGSPGCVARWSVVHGRGDLTIDGGSGAGVLLVDGRLRITGAFRYTGLVVARGGVEILTDGSMFTGAVVAGGESGSGVPAMLLSAVAELRASRCAVWQALAARARPRRVAGRWWSELL